MEKHSAVASRSSSMRRLCSSTSWPVHRFPQGGRETRPAAQQPGTTNFRRSENDLTFALVTRRREILLRTQNAERVAAPPRFWCRLSTFGSSASAFSSCARITRTT